MKKKLSAKQAEKLVKKIEKKLHKIGEHGAVGFLTQQGRICVECNKPIVEPKLASPTTNTNRNGSSLVVDPKCICKGLEVGCQCICHRLNDSLMDAHAKNCICKPEPKCGCFCHFDGVNFHPKGKASCSHCEPLQSEPKCRCGLSLSTCEELCIKGVCACSRLGKHSFVEPEPKCLSCSGRVYKKNVCRNHYQMYGEPSQSSWESEYRKLWLTPQGYTVTNVEQLQKIVKSFIKSLLARQKNLMKLNIHLGLGLMML